MISPSTFIQLDVIWEISSYDEVNLAKPSSAHSVGGIIKSGRAIQWFEGRWDPCKCQILQLSGGGGLAEVLKYPFAMLNS